MWHNWYRYIIIEYGIKNCLHLPTECMNLTKLSFDWNHLKGSGFNNIKNIFRCPLWRLSELSLAHCSLYDQEVIELSKGIIENNFLQVLNLSSNNIQDKSSNSIKTINSQPTINTAVNLQPRYIGLDKYG